MTENQTALKESIGTAWDRYRERMPELSRAYDDLTAEAYAGGAVEAKTKRLMALCAALIKGCRACILYQTDNALRLGASVDELLETCGVAVSLGGTMAAGEATRLMQYLEERDMLSASGPE